MVNGNAGIHSAFSHAREEPCLETFSRQGYSSERFDEFNQQLEDLRKLAIEKDSAQLLAVEATLNPIISIAGPIRCSGWQPGRDNQLRLQRVNLLTCAHDKTETNTCTEVVIQVSIEFPREVLRQDPPTWTREMRLASPVIWSRPTFSRR